MDTDQLKMIIDLLANAGEGAFWIALLWVLKGYFLATLWAATIVVFFRMVIASITLYEEKAARKRDEQFG